MQAPATQEGGNPNRLLENPCIIPQSAGITRPIALFPGYPSESFRAPPKKSTDPQKLTLAALHFRTANPSSRFTLSSPPSVLPSCAITILLLLQGEYSIMLTQCRFLISADTLFSLFLPSPSCSLQRSFQSS